MEQLPKLQAQESLDRIAQLTAAGGRQMDDANYRSFMRSLNRAAGQGRRAIKATLASLKQIGIAVETLPPPEPKE